MDQRLEIELKQLDEVVIEVQRILSKYQNYQDPDLLPAIAMNLQSLYTGIERIMVSVALEFETVVPEGKDWHRQLLKQMAFAVPDIRPAFLAAETQLYLDELRRFRHVVRSIYAFKLDPDLLVPIAQQLPDWYPQFKHRCQQFLRQGLP